MKRYKKHSNANLVTIVIFLHFYNKKDIFYYSNVQNTKYYQNLTMQTVSECESFIKNNHYEAFISPEDLWLRE